MVIGRFQVMALLQAARAFILGLPLETAKSWGLNRAIFYAAAKRGFKGTSPLTAEFRAARGRPAEEAPAVHHLGDEMAFTEIRNNRMFFTIGAKIQTAADFARQIEARFGDSFEEAWSEAPQLLRQFDRATLESQQAFFSQVYRPRRDELGQRWTAFSLQPRVKWRTASVEDAARS